jgi:hypothetical protein
MTSKKTLTLENLIPLGAPRLAELLLEISEGDAATKRRLRLELASVLDPKDAAKEIKKRITTIGRSKTGVYEWDKVRALAHDLEAQRRGIETMIAPTAPSEALDLLWDMLAISPSVYARCDDSNGEVQSVMADVFETINTVVANAKINPKSIADKVAALLKQPDEYAAYHNIIPKLTPALGRDGLQALRAVIETFPKNQKVVTAAMTAGSGCWRLRKG